jgi:hypothetical protein
MADTIYVTYTPTGVPETFHTAIHYIRTSPAGEVIKHVVVEAKPGNKLNVADKAIGVLEEAFRDGDSPSRFGSIHAKVRDRAESNTLEEASDDPNAPREIIAEGDDLSENLARIQLSAHGFNQAGFAHRGGRQNSNTFASAALQAGKLPPATGVAHDPTGLPGELLDFFVPGLNEPLRPSVGQRSSNENGNGVQHTSVSGLGGEPFRESVANTTGTSNAVGRGVLIEGIVYDESEDFARWSPEWIERRPNLSPEDRWIAAPSRYPSCKTRIEPFGDHYYYVAEEC